jgi:8-oxo-dGTP pyrophosphatase MutT (NUDIX family)
VTEPAAPGRPRGGAQQIPRPARVTVSDEAPWPTAFAPTLDSLVAAVPLDAAPVLPAFPGSRLSAVLIVLAEGDDGVEVLLTRRSMAMRNHKGEISFPGGRVDDGESAVEAALREAHEEVGLDPATPRVVGELAHLNTIVSRSYIVPVVATLGGRPELEAQTGEVDRVLWTPFDRLTSPGAYHVETWGEPPLDRPLHFFELDDETVWGATAHMLVDLLAASAGVVRPTYD